MSNKLKRWVDYLQFAKGWTQEQVAESIGYSRVHLAREMKKPSSQLEKILWDKHKSVLQNETTVTPQSPDKEDRYLALMEERVKELKEDKEWLKRTVDLSLGSISIAQRSILAHLEVSLEQDERREAAGNKKKETHLRELRDRRIAEILQGAKEKDRYAGIDGNMG